MSIVLFRSLINSDTTKKKIQKNYPITVSTKSDEKRRKHAKNGISMHVCTEYVTYCVITIKHILRPHATNLQPLVLTLWPRRHATFLPFSLFLAFSSKPVALIPSRLLLLSSTTACALLLFSFCFSFVSFTYTYNVHSFLFSFCIKKETAFEYTERAICVNFAGNAAIHCYTHTSFIVWSVFDV